LSIFLEFLSKFLVLYFILLSLMFEYVPYLSFLTSGLGLFFIAFLGIRFRQIPSVYGLMFIIFALVFLEFYIYALTSKHIYQMLFLLRTPNIIRAFLPVVLFLYVRAMLHPQHKIAGFQWLHFVFPVGVLIALMPDLFMSAAAKTAILDAYYRQNNFFISTPSGWIPAGFVQPVSISIGIIYGIASLLIIRRTKKIYGADYVYVNRQNLVWLNLLTWAVTVYFLLQLYQYVNLFLNNSFDPPSQIIKCLLGITLFFYFMTTPNVQENMDGCIIPVDNPTPSPQVIEPTLLPEFSQDTMAIQLDQQVKLSQDFLNKDFDLPRMAESFEMSPVKLSKLIRKYYGISFTEFTNRLRIHAFLKQATNLNPYTLETHMYQSGFSNRSTFYVAFKKYVGVNPSFYLRERP